MNSSPQTVGETLFLVLAGLVVTVLVSAAYVAVLAVLGGIGWLLS